MSNCYLARQPIYDKNLEVYAYELLYRTAPEDHAPGNVGDTATSEVIANTLTEIGLHQLVGEKFAFINFTRNFIVDEDHAPLPFHDKQIVIEVLEDIPADQDVIKGVQRLRHQGHTIALDDFCYSDSMIPLLEIVDIVKVDVLSINQDQLHSYANTLKNYDVQLLAEKIETEECYQLCRELGFELFQGYHFCRPRLYTQQRLSTNKLLILQLLAEINDPGVSIDKLVDIISRDVSLSYKLLRYINSAFFSLSSKIDSVRHAVVYLGLETVKQIATLLTLSDVDESRHELFIIAMTRAKMCESLAETLKLPNKESYFLVGLFSVLDGLLDTKMSTILESLSLTHEINSALLTHENQLGEILNLTIAYEKGDWERISPLDLDPKTKANAYLDALIWACNNPF